MIKNDSEIEDAYVIVVLNYNDDIQHLTARSAGVYETNDVINAFMDELNVDFSIPVSPGQYVIAKYAVSNANSIFTHMAHLGFPESFPLPDEWIHLLSTEPQTQVSIENIEEKLNINAAIAGAGINIIVINKVPLL
ncbi:Uncharacterised protein [uncultured Eubacterium sp.]|nr:Uncharacterised protein [uncultured Eubacterium sp.]